MNLIRNIMFELFYYILSTVIFFFLQYGLTVFVLVSWHGEGGGDPMAYLRRAVRTRNAVTARLTNGKGGDLM